MSDADNQMGGAAGPDDESDDQDQEDPDGVDEASKESFPASDPPANY